jgi:hypothetical protein
LATVVIPKANLIWGGHPAITPLLRFVMEKMDSDLKQHITLYQSDFFRDYFPKDNFHFENIKIVKEEHDRESSLIKMREQMFIENNFSVGIFIGGMEGVIEEFGLFKKYNPNALILPIASTGAAARIIYETIDSEKDDRFLNDYAYMSLFRDYLSELLK